MSNLTNSFIFLTFLNFFSFWLLLKSKPGFLTSKQLKSWLTIWFSVVAVAFITHNLWITYFLLLTIFNFFIPPSSQSRITYFALLLCSLPIIPIAVRGIFGIKNILVLTYPLVLTILLLLPVLLFGQANRNIIKSNTDKYIYLFILIISILNFRDNTITNAFRVSVITIFTIYFPYFAISRYIHTSEQLRSVITALFIGLFPLTIIGIFEAIKHWHLYDSLLMNLTDIQAQKNRYDSRAGLLRATTVFSSPIIYGYTMVIGIGLLLYLRPLISKLHFKLILLLFIIALLCSFSRGPWVGLVLLFIAYYWTEKGAIKNILTMSLASFFMLSLLSFTTFGQKIINLLPFIGTSRSDTLDYRELLLENAWIVFQRQPWFGSTNFLETPEMESMRQGQGIIDIVNSYLQIVLSYGTFGLLLFLAIFFGLLHRCYRMIKRLPKEETELIRMGKSLFATLTAILFIIFTVSSIDYIPIFYWTFAGITAAYLNICNQVLKSISSKKGNYT